jgi:hypothetical protein
VWFEITNLLTRQDDTEAGHPDQGPRDRDQERGPLRLHRQLHDVEGGSTWCHACGELLIGRDWIGSAPGT